MRAPERDAAARGRKVGEVRLYPLPGAAPSGATCERREWAFAVEAPCEIRLNRQPIATMMATPTDLEDFAIGFCLAEGLIDAAAPTEGISIEPAGPGFIVNVAVPVADPARDAGARGRTGYSSCGVCGVASIDAALGGIVPVKARPPVSAAAVATAFATLVDHQPLNAITHSVHAAAAADADGRLGYAREDVGRHNAVDKVLGALARAGALPWPGFLVTSSRASIEIVQKASVAGASLVATLSAPTTLAVEAARAAGMKLATRGPGGSVVFVD